MWLCISLVCFLLGARLLSLLRASPEGLGERALLSIGVGYVAFGYVVLLIGLVGQLYARHIVAAAALCAAVSYTEIGFLGRCGGRLWWKAKAPRLDAAGRAVYAFIGFWLLLGLLNALAPPGWLDWDGLSHHLAVPREYIRHHEIAYVPWTSHSNFPYATQMLFTVGLMLRGAAAAKLFHFVYAPLSLAALGVLCRRFLPAGCGRFAAAAYCCIPLTGWLAGIAYVDLGVAFFTIIAVHFFLAWAVDGERRGLAWAGLACGLGMCVKAQMGMVLGVLLCLAVLASVLRRGEGALRSVGRIAAAAGIAAALCWPWYLKSYLWTGNPVYPFAYSVFGGRNFSAADAAAYTRHQMRFGMPPRAGEAGAGTEEPASPRTARNLLLVAWNVTMHPRHFDVIDMPPSMIYGCGAIGPLFLAFVPPLVFMRGKRPGVRWMLGFVAVFLVGWFYTMQYARYLVPCLGVACTLVGCCVQRCWSQGAIVRAAAGTLLGASCVAVTVGLLYHSLPRVGTALGLESHHAYLDSNLGVYRASQSINALTPPTAKVATYGETRVFYIEREVMWADPGHHQMMQYGQMRSGADLVARYREFRVTHVLLGPSVLGRLVDRADRAQLLVLLREAFGKGLLRLPDEMR
ncbi:MAG: hypothetical protein PVH68_14795, partial [Armatimonadota bacterium]